MRRLGGKGLAALDGAQVQFTHLLCFAKCPPGTPRVGCGAADGLTDLGSTVPDVVARGPKPGGLRKGACCMGATATAAVVKWAQRRLPGPGDGDRSLLRRWHRAGGGQCVRPAGHRPGQS